MIFLHQLDRVDLKLVILIVPMQLPSMVRGLTL